MQCPKCGSTDVRSSLRRGLREGFFLRIIFRAPYRCKKCGTRFFGFSRLPGVGKHKKHKTLGSFLGLHGAQARRFRRVFIVVILFVLLILLALYLVYYLSIPAPPPSFQ